MSTTIYCCVIMTDISHNDSTLSTYMYKSTCIHHHLLVFAFLSASLPTWKKYYIHFYIYIHICHMMFDTSLRRMIFVRKLIFTNPECWIIINAQKSRKNADTILNLDIYFLGSEWVCNLWIHIRIESKIYNLIPSLLHLIFRVYQRGCFRSYIFNLPSRLLWPVLLG